jgi:hypothetical protein
MRPASAVIVQGKHQPVGWTFTGVVAGPVVFSLQRV